MTTRLIYRIVIVALALSIAAPALAQISSRPTPPPTVTAENEAWYMSGEPIMFNGNVYYPSGPITHFLRNEMIRSGIYGNTPIYSRTTQEPWSIVYVPLAGGVVRPYERRRSGDLAGTVGSSVSSFPITLPAEEASATFVAAIRAPAPPTGVPVGTVGVTPPSTVVAAPAAVAAPVPVPVGTAGTVAVSSPVPARTRVQTVRRPVGLNNVFIDLDGARWFAAGPAVEFSSQRFARAGEYRGFPVYKENPGSDVIYLSLIPGAPGLVTPYKRR
jgi:hypothetical protein